MEAVFFIIFVQLSHIFFHVTGINIPVNLNPHTGIFQYSNLPVRKSVSENPISNYLNPPPTKLIKTKTNNPRQWLSKACTWPRNRVRTRIKIWTEHTKPMMMVSCLLSQKDSWQGRPKKDRPVGGNPNQINPQNVLKRSTFKFSRSSLVTRKKCSFRASFYFFPWMSRRPKY